MLSSMLTRRMSVLVLAEHANGKVSQGTYAALSAAKAINQGPIKMLVAGSDSKAASEDAAKLDGVDAVFNATDAKYDHGMAESVSNLLVSLQNKEKFTHIVALASNEGKNILPRAGAQLDVQPVSDVIEVKDADTFVRPIYAGNALATVKSSDAVKLLTVRSTAFAKTGETKADAAPIESVSEDSGSAGAEWQADEIAQSDRPELSSAKRVVCGGRGLKSGENFEILFKLADKLGAGVGASRAAVDAGYCPNDMQIGQTGKVVAPELYIGFGISGAVQHLAGMKDSKVIACVNKDPEAPIFQVSDFGLEGDLFQVVPELTEKV